MVKSNFALANLCGTVYRRVGSVFCAQIPVSLADGPDNVSYVIFIYEYTSAVQGNLLFTSDGTSIISPLGNRVGVFDLVKYVSRVPVLSCHGEADGLGDMRIAATRAVPYHSRTERTSLELHSHQTRIY